MSMEFISQHHVGNSALYPVFIPCFWKKYMLNFRCGIWYDHETVREVIRWNLTDYMHLNADTLYLTTNGSVELWLYDAKGVLLSVSKTDKNSHFKKIDVSNVSFVKLAGNGTLNKFEINGFH